MQGSTFQKILHTFPNGKEIPIIKGTPGDRLIFDKYLFNKKGWTFFHVTKYDTKGDQFDKIWASLTNEWISGLSLSLWLNRPRREPFPPS